MNQNTDEIIEDMAKAGYEAIFDRTEDESDDEPDELWDNLGNNSPIKGLWRKVAKKMLLSVKFPAELYKVYRDLNFNAERKK